MSFYLLLRSDQSFLMEEEYLVNRLYFTLPKVGTAYNKTFSKNDTYL